MDAYYNDNGLQHLGQVDKDGVFDFAQHHLSRHSDHLDVEAGEGSSKQTAHNAEKYGHCQQGYVNLDRLHNLDKQSKVLHVCTARKV